MSDFLSVSEFAAQLEVDKHPSQIYTWMKSGLPFEIQAGRKVIPFSKGLEWLQERQRMSAKQKRAKAPLKRRSVGQEAFKPTYQVGDFIRWSRGNDRGPAYGMIQKVIDGLVCVAVEYRTRPIYFAEDEFLHDLGTHKVKLVHSTEVASFIMCELARLDFLVHLSCGADKANDFKALVKNLSIVPAGMMERFHEAGRRKSKGWPDESINLEDVSNEVQVGTGAVGSN